MPSFQQVSFLSCLHGRIGSPILRHTPGKGQSYIFPSQRGRGIGEMCSLLLQLVTLRNILGKVCSPVIDTVKWRRLQRNLWAPLIIFSIISISYCLFLTDIRSQSQALFKLKASLHPQSTSLLLSRHKRMLDTQPCAWDITQRRGQGDLGSHCSLRWSLLCV